MGSIWSRNADEVQEIDTNDAQTYTYPPPTGSYFGSHFFMGGKKFDTVQPEAYLFGDNTDLNMLGPKPFNFPYHLPSGNEPIRALKCLVNIRKDTLRLIRISNPTLKPDDIIQTNEESQTTNEQPQGEPLYNMEFTFDAECPCSITVYYNASEEMQNKVVNFTTKQQSDTIHYNTGCNQQFCVTNHIINPITLHLKDRPKTWDFTNIPIAIQVSTECQDNLFHGHSHITYATFEKVSEESWTIKPIKQKQAINGVCYLIQEIYGIENKTKLPDNGEDPIYQAVDNEDDVDDDDESAECVVCLSDMRDTIILPCKHLCLCSTCANQLRFQQSGCPICRQSFRALLQIRAIRRKAPSAMSSGDTSLAVYEDGEQEDSQSVDTAAEAANEEASLPFQISIPPGFEVVPLISAINGPASASSASLSTTRDITRTSSVISTTSSLSRSVKSKAKTMVEVENEVTCALGSSGDGGADTDRKRTKGKKKSFKKKNKNTKETECEEAMSSKQTTSAENNVDAIEEKEIQSEDKPITEAESEDIKESIPTQIVAKHKELNPSSQTKEVESSSNSFPPADVVENCTPDDSDRKESAPKQKLHVQDPLGVTEMGDEVEEPEFFPAPESITAENKV